MCTFPLKRGSGNHERAGYMGVYGRVYMRGGYTLVQPGSWKQEKRREAGEKQEKRRKTGEHEKQRRHRM